MEKEAKSKRSGKPMKLHIFDLIEGKGLSIKDTAKILGVHQRTVSRMIEDGRLEAALIDDWKGKYWAVNIVSIAKLMVKKEESERKQYPRANKKFKEVK